jgi:hypothetical protein
LQWGLASTVGSALSRACTEEYLDSMRMSVNHSPVERGTPPSITTIYTSFACSASSASSAASCRHSLPLMHSSCGSSYRRASFIRPIPPLKQQPKSLTRAACSCSMVEHRLTVTVTRQNCGDKGRRETWRRIPSAISLRT